MGEQLLISPLTATTLWQQHLESIHSAVNQTLKEAGVDPMSVPGLECIFNPEGTHGHPFSGLETQYRQMKYYKQYFEVVEPVRVPLGERRVWKGRGRKRRCVQVQDSLMYIPLLQTLEVLLQNDSIHAQLENGHQSQSGYSEDFCDGEVFKSHPLYSLHCDGLQLFLYFDEVEICNPLGSKRKKHKLGFFYFTLGNLMPRYRSSLSAIQLLGIVKRSAMVEYGTNAVLQPFIDDIKKLESGYTFHIRGGTKLVYGTVAAVSADNLASNALGGFKESCSASRPCRQCLATQDEARSQFQELQFTLRDPESHKSHCAQVESPPDNDTDYSALYGVNHDSVLNSLSYFNVCDGGLVPDVMHDLLEGALQYEVKLMLKEFILHDHYFTLERLNSKLENMELGYMESKDRPSPISDVTLKSKDNRLTQAAAQMLLLAKVLPLAIGNRVPTDDDRWMNFIRMREIVSYLFCPKVAEDDAAYLQALISDHHTEFRHIYPGRSVIPKMHFMIHMPRLMLSPTVKWKAIHPCVRLYAGMHDFNHCLQCTEHGWAYMYIVCHSELNAEVYEQKG